METLLKDVRYACAMMRRNPGFTTAGLLTLALGIGATTAVFSVVYGVLLRPLAYPNAGRLVELSEEHPGAVTPLRSAVLSNLTYHAWQLGPTTIDVLAAYSNGDYTMALPRGPQRLAAAGVTASMFPLIGARPALGRFFRPGEGAAGNDALIVLSDRAWREYFDGDPSIVGRGVVMDERPYTIIGVAQPGFSFPDRKTMIWLPYEVAPPSPDAVAGARGVMRVLHAYARLAPGATPEQAAAEGTARARTAVRPMAANLIFGEGGPVVVRARGLVDAMTERVRPALLVLGAAVLLVLLIACANVANLFLSRGVARQRELTVRAAIGASRGRLASQLLTESAVLSAAGGALGVALAWALVRLALLFAARDFPRIDGVAIDGRVLLFALAASAFTALASGLAPALRGARVELARSLHGGDGAFAGGFRGVHAQRLRDALLGAEAAFAVLLLIGAMLLGRSFVRLTKVDAGYTASNVLVAQLFIPGPTTPERGDRIAVSAQQMRERLQSAPGVTAVGIGNMMPLDNATQLSSFPAPGQPSTSKPRIARSITYVVTPGYAEALGLRLRAGRLFTEGDLSADVRPWIVNQEFARLYLAPNPIGLQWTWPATATSPPRTNEIVGIVADVLKNGNDARPQAENYQIVHAPARLFGQFEIAVKTTGEPSAIASLLRRTIQEIEPTAAFELTTMDQRVSESMDQPRFAMSILVTFAALALALASLGLHGVLSYGVSQRRRELGVRAALGAGRRDLVGLVLREGLTVTAIGLAIGLAGAAALTRLMQSVLFGVAPLDPVSFAVAPLMLGLVAVVACLLPASRAASTDPAEALRCE